jgi:hypothetical protein
MNAEIMGVESDPYYVAEGDWEERHELQKQGIAVAKEAGRYLGRPRIEYPENWEDCYSRWKAGVITAKEAMTLLGLEDGDNATTGHGYLDIVDFILQNCTDVERNLQELYRRVAFNICIGNIKVNCSWKTYCINAGLSKLLCSTERPVTTYDILAH